jgi:hypothetical protein
MIYKFAVLTLMLGSSLVLTPQAKAEETRVDVIFTGVVPSTCVVEAPSNNTTENANRNQRYTFQTASSAQVVCNDGAQINTEEFTHSVQPGSNLESTTLQRNLQNYLTITAP